ncbi:hypothetical protein R1flu_008866 [Riccia fluitans]|uniref:Uncharacterized protein n=1 Tax=Riccia fluitans TaxID=41844 RepID=A0ABD1Z0F4_9MARC
MFFFLRTKFKATGHGNGGRARRPPSRRHAGKRPGGQADQADRVDALRQADAAALKCPVGRSWVHEEGGRGK